MIELRSAVIAADEKGEGVEAALQDLREHVHAHMNTNLTSGNNAIRPPIQLVHTYERLQEKERQRVAAINEKVSATATEICERRYPAGQLRSGRVQCVQNYLTENSVEEKEVPKELYQFDFASPTWSPDLAGWSLLLSGVLLMLFILRVLLEAWLKRQLD